MKLDEELTSLEIPRNQINDILSVWEGNYQRVTKLLLSRTVSSNALIDVDWSFGVTSSTDSCEHVGRTYLQLKLTLDRGDLGHENVYVELSLENFYSFLGQIEKMKGYLDILQPDTSRAPT